jgi:hypothetical protein
MGLYLEEFGNFKEYRNHQGETQSAAKDPQKSA